jgi:hypothetical protein
MPARAGPLPAADGPAGACVDLLCNSQFYLRYRALNPALASSSEPTTPLFGGGRRLRLEEPHPLRIALYDLRIDAIDHDLAVKDAIVILAPDVRIPAGDQGLRLRLAQQSVSGRSLREGAGGLLPGVPSGRLGMTGNASTWLLFRRFTIVQPCSAARRSTS